MNSSPAGWQKTVQRGGRSLRIPASISADRYCASPRKTSFEVSLKLNYFCNRSSDGISTRCTLFSGAISRLPVNWFIYADFTVSTRRRFTMCMNSCVFPDRGGPVITICSIFEAFFLQNSAIIITLDMPSSAIVGINTLDMEWKTTLHKHARDLGQVWRCCSGRVVAHHHWWCSDAFASKEPRTRTRGACSGIGRTRTWLNCSIEPAFSIYADLRPLWGSFYYWNLDPAHSRGLAGWYRQWTKRNAPKTLYCQIGAIAVGISILQSTTRRVVFLGCFAIRR